MSFKRSFFKSISSFAAYNYISQSFEFLSTIILSRLLLPHEYGFVAIINIFSGFILLFANVGIGQTVVRSNYGYTFHRQLYSLSVYIGFILMITLSLLSYPISVFFNNPELIIPTIVISLKFLIDSFIYIPEAILSKNLKFNIVGRAKFWNAVIQITLTILLALIGFSYWSLIIPMIIGPALQLIYIRSKVDIPFKFYSWGATKRTLSKIKTLMGALSLSNLFSYWTFNADKLVIGKIYGQADLGLYNRAFRFVQVSNTLITNIFNTVLFPSLKKLIVEKGDVAKEYTDILRIITLFNMPIAIILVIFPVELVSILWGSNWSGVAQYLPYVALILIFNSIISSSGSVYILYEKEKNMYLINMFSSFITIIVVIAGGFISMLHIMRFLVLSNIFIIVPTLAYYGFYKSFQYRPIIILRFWIPLIIYIGILFLASYFNITWLKVMGFVLYLSILLTELRTSVKGVFLFLKKRSIKTN